MKIHFYCLGFRGNFHRPHLFKHPVLSRDAEALEKVQKLAPKFVKGLRHISYEAALSYTPTNQCAKSLMASMESTFTHLTHLGLRGHAYRFHQQRYCTRRRQYAFTLRAAPFWNKLTAEIVNASSMKYFKTLLDVNWQSLFPKVPL